MVDSMTESYMGPAATRQAQNHQHVLLLVEGVCADVLFRISPNVPLCIMARVFSRSLMVCLDANLQT